MGMLAGVFYFDSRPVSSEDKGCILAVSVGDVRLHVAPGLAMVQDAAPDSPRRPQQSYFQAIGGDICTFEGRLDNAADLVGAGDSLPTQTPLSELVLSLYRKNGLGFLHDLIGDWSIALWDARDRAILLASDYAGVRPLYYCRTAASLKWSSSLEHLLRWTGAPDLDEDYLAGMISGGCAVGRTPYRGIDSVQPGTFLRAARDSFVTTRFWQPSTDRCISYGSEAEYAERLRSLFEEAVAVRLNTKQPVCAELSGGLDSSSIVCMANRLVTSGACTAPGITSFSYHTEGTNDDTFISAVEQFCKNPGVHIGTDECPPVSNLCAGGSAPHWGAPRWAEVSRRMAGLGSNVLLTGQAGDLVMGNWLDDAEQASDYLRQGHVLRAVKESFAWSRSLQVPVYPILWRALRPDDSAAAYTASNRYESFTRGFRKRAESLDGDHNSWEYPRGVLPSQRKRLQGLINLLSSGALRSPETLTGAYTAHPFAHRPLVEFMLSVPSAFTCRPGEPRRLMRRALKGIVPEVVRRRRSKGNYEAMFLRALRTCAAELLRNPGHLRLVEFGYLEGKSIESRFERLVQGLPCNESQLRQVILLEVWLRQRQRRCGDSDELRRGHPEVVEYPGAALPGYVTPR